MHPKYEDNFNLEEKLKKTRDLLDRFRGYPDCDYKYYGYLITDAIDEIDKILEEIKNTDSGERS